MKIRDYLGEAETADQKKGDKLEKKMAKGVGKLSGVTNAADTDPEREKLQNEQLHPLVAEHFGLGQLAKEEVEKWHVYDTKTNKVHSTHDNKNKAEKAYNQLNKDYQGYETPGGLIQGKYGMRKEEKLDELKASTIQSFADKRHQQALDATYDAAHLNRTGEEGLKADAKARASKYAGAVQKAQTKLDRKYNAAGDAYRAHTGINSNKLYNKEELEEIYYETLDLFLEALMSPEVRERIKAHELAGHKTSDQTSRMKNGEMEYSFVVTQPSGKRSRHIYHGNKTKHETMSPAPRSKEAHETGEDDEDK